MSDFFRGHSGQMFQDSGEKNVYLEKQTLVTIVEAAGMAIWQWDLRNHQFLFNEQWLEVSGYQLLDLEPVSLQTWIDLIHPDDYAKTEKKLFDLLESNIVSYQHQLRIKHKTKGWIWVEDQAQVMCRNDNGEAAVIAGTRIDISQRMKDKKRLLKRDELLTKLSRQVPGTIFQFRMGETEAPWFPFCSESISHLFEVERAEVAVNPRKIFNRIHTEDLEKFRETIRESYQNMSIWEEEFRVDLPVRGQRWIRGIAQPEKTDSDAVIWNGYMTDITNRKMMERVIYSSEEKYRMLSEKSPIIIFQWEKNYAKGTMGFLFMGEKVIDIIGVSSYDIENDSARIFDLIYPEDFIKLQLEFEESERELRDFYQIVRIRHSSDSQVEIWIEIRATPEKNEDSHAIVWSGAFVDITDIKKQEREMFLEKEKFHTTLMSLGEGVVSVNEFGNIVFINPAAQIITGCQPEDIYGQPLEKVFCVIDEYDGALIIDHFKDVLVSGRSVKFSKDVLLVTQKDKKIPVSITASAIRDHQQAITGMVIVFSDDTEKKEHLKEIEYLSFHDQLTGLYNRRFYDEELQRLNQKRNYPLALLLIDVNGMKLINDAFGHAQGDILLQEVAETLKAECRADDIIARIGGDEFAVILPGTTDKDVKTLTIRIREKLSEKKIKGVPLSASFGWAVKVSDQLEKESLFKQAEDSMYRKKIKHRQKQRKEAVDLMLEELFSTNPWEREHSRNVSLVAREIGKVLGLTKAKIQRLQLAGYFHDIGKLVVEAAILEKQSSLSGDEWQAIRKHSEVSASILSTVNEYSEMTDWLLGHHERWDGTGYPNGVSGEAIPLEARIIAAADAFCAMQEERPYRLPISRQEAIQYMVSDKGSKFDPKVVEALQNTSFFQ